MNNLIFLKLIKNFLNKNFYFLFLFFYVCTIYISTKGLIELLGKHIIPTGDPFTYAVTWMAHLEFLSDQSWLEIMFSLKNYMSWYVVHIFMLNIFSSLIVNKFSSLALINFLPFFLSLCLIYSVLSSMKLHKYLKYTITFFYASLPIHWNINIPTNLYSLQLDSIYINCLISSIFILLYNFSRNAKPNISLDILSAFILAANVYVRPNSIYLILIFSFFIGLIFLIKYGFKSILLKIKKHILFLILFFSIVSIYFAVFWEVVFNYYKHTAHLSSFDFSLFLKFIKMPMYFFWTGSQQISFNVQLFFIIIHFFPIIISIILRNKNFLLFAFSLSYVFTFILLNYSYHSIQVIHSYAPLFIIWFILSVLVFIYFFNSYVNKNYFLKFKIQYFIPLIAFIFSYSQVFFTVQAAVLDSKSKSHLFSIEEIKKLSLDTHKFLGVDRSNNISVAFLIYGSRINLAILNFYRISEYKKIYQFNNYIDGVEYYKNVYWDDLWQAYSPDKREGLINGLAETFNNADIVFVPETSSCIDNYANVYNLYREHNITMKIIKENLYKFEVIKKIKESDNCNVLVLKRL